MKSPLPLGLTLLACGWIAGCGPGNSAAENQNARAYYVDADAAAAAKKGEAFEDPSKVAPAPDEGEPDIPALEKGQGNAKTAYVGHTHDAKVKQTYIVATMRLAYAYESSDKVDRKEKYKKALHFFREVLKVDPKNNDAQARSQEIIDVYHSLNKPVPTE